MPCKVSVFKLSKKFVDEQDAPPEVRQLEYYALAIGHHIGVLDCLSPVMVMDEEDYLKWIRKLPAGKARNKLEGLAKWGELEIHREHVTSLESAIRGADASFTPEEKTWAQQMLQLLQSIKMEPAIYLVVRRSEGERFSDHRGQRADGG
jgi:hypothetical protein